MRISDEQLIEDARRLSRKFTPYGFNTYDKEDIQQEVTIALLEARERFDPKISPWGNFAYIRARGAVQDFLRNSTIQGKNQKRSGRVTYFSSYENQIHEAPTEELYENLQFEEFLDTLNKRDKFIIICLMRGHTAQEIAHMLHTSLNAIHRALQDLRIVNSRSWLWRQRD